MGGLWRGFLFGKLENLKGWVRRFGKMRESRGCWEEICSEGKRNKTMTATTSTKLDEALSFTPGYKVRSLARQPVAQVVNDRLLLDL